MKTFWIVSDRGNIVGHEVREIDYPADLALDLEITTREMEAKYYASIGYTGDPRGGLTPIEDHSGAKAHTPRGERMVIAFAALLILAVCLGLLVEYGL